MVRCTRTKARAAKRSAAAASRVSTFFEKPSVRHVKRRDSMRAFRFWRSMGAVRFPEGFPGDCRRLAVPSFGIMQAETTLAR